MTIYSSKSKQAFFDSNITTSLPNDAQEIEPEIWQSLLQAQSDGKYIDWTGEQPVAADYPPPTQEQLIAQAEREKSSLLDLAASKIVVWQTKLLIGRKLTESEAAQLNAWLDYIDEVSSVDTSNPTWPNPPEAA